jgi:hypothetical protein
MVGMDDHEAVTGRRPTFIAGSATGTNCSDAVDSPCRGRFESLLETWPFGERPASLRIGFRMDAARGQESVIADNMCNLQGQPCPVVSFSMNIPPDAGWADIPPLAQLIAPKMAIMARWLEVAPHIPDLESEAFFSVGFRVQRVADYSERDWEHMTEFIDAFKRDQSGLWVPAKTSPSTLFTELGIFYSRRYTALYRKALGWDD